jgi:glycosyltransferase involved in cell wall biosynthesis
MNPLVSIIVPTLNRKQFIKETIKSVNRQTYINLEIIISDNGSNYSVREYLNDDISTDPRIIFRENTTTVSMASHFNQCLDLATGEYIFYISDDDLISENYIELMVKRFQEDKKISIGISTTEIIDINTVVNEKITTTIWAQKDGKEFIFDWLLRDISIPVVSFISVFTKTHLLKSLGGFPDFEGGCHIDNALAINLCWKGDIIFVKDVSFFYRVYSASYGLSMPLKKLELGSNEFTKYYLNDKASLFDKDLKANKKPLLKGIRYLAFGLYFSRALSLYSVWNFNFIKALMVYGLGYYELGFLIKKASNKILK